MRRLLFLVSIGVFVVVLLAITPPAHAPAEVAFEPTRTLLPEGLTILPVFTPSYPCELESAEARDDDLCRNERVQEQAIFESDTTVLYTRDYHLGMGCWRGTSVITRELRVCDRSSGNVTSLVNRVTSNPMPSVDGEWYGFTVLETLPNVQFNALRPHVYRVRANGTDLQQLNSQGFPEGIVGARIESWSDDGEWLELSLWDGREDSWHPYRLRTDGSGAYEPLSE